MENTKTWEKMERDAKKAGFRNGAYKGKNDSFQTNFDMGYEDGFKNGLIMGKQKAELRIKNINEPLLENTKAGACVMCKNSEVLNFNSEQIRQKQSENCNVLLEAINSKYTST